jgi:hypothetical protein
MRLVRWIFEKYLKDLFEQGDSVYHLQIKFAFFSHSGMPIYHIDMTMGIFFPGKISNINGYIQWHSKENRWSMNRYIRFLPDNDPPPPNLFPEFDDAEYALKLVDQAFERMKNHYLENLEKEREIIINFLLYPCLPQEIKNHVLSFIGI